MDDTESTIKTFPTQTTHESEFHKILTKNKSQEIYSNTELTFRTFSKFEFA